MNLRNIQKAAALAALSVLAAAPAAPADKSGLGPRTTYEKSKESTTGGADAGAGACLSIPEPGDAKAVTDTFRRQAHLAEELRKRCVEASQAHDKRLDQLKELDRQLGEAEATEIAIAQNQPKATHLAEVRQIRENLRHQKQRLSDFDRAEERGLQRLLKDAETAQHCAREMVERRQELRQGTLEERRGTVEFRHHGGRFNNWAAAEGDIVLHPGDSVRTGADGHVRLRLPDGSLLELGPSAGFALSADPGILGEQISGNLLYKLQQFHGKMEVRTPTAAVAVRGTTFSLKVEAGKATGLTAVDGKVEFTALPGAADAARQSAWWAGRAPQAEGDTLPAGTLARLGEGPARLKHRGGAWETARAGDELNPDDLVRADAGPVPLMLPGGTAAVLAPGSVMQVRQDKDGRPLYGLWRGRLYARRPPGASGPEPTYTSPTAVCAARGTEFEYHVPEGEAPEFVIYDGAIEVTADEKRFQNPDLFRNWWEE